MSRDERGQSIRVGNIENSTGIAIGNKVSVAVNQPTASLQTEVSALLDEFVQSLERYGDVLADTQSVRRSVAEARAEVASPTPKWQAVRRTLASIAAAVAGVAALTDAISNIQGLVN
jgi:hypothetical protein